MPRVHIDVMLKDEILDPQGQAVERALPSLGFGAVTAVRIGKHIELDLADDADLDERVTAIADQLLANPVIERFTYRVDPEGGDQAEQVRTADQGEPDRGADHAGHARGADAAGPDPGPRLAGRSAHSRHP